MQPENHMEQQVSETSYFWLLQNNEKALVHDIK